jgi:chromosome segregation protein
VVSEQRSETVPGAGLAWAQDQVYQLKAQVGTLEQQIDHLQSLVTQVTESMRTVERSLREALSGAGQAERLQEELNQSVALIVQLQDQQAETSERLDAVSREQKAEESRDQLEWTEIVRRTDQLERQVASWSDRQAGVDEVGRRFQEGLSVIRQQIQNIDQRLEAAESKAARGLEGANRAEHTITQVEASILELKREDESIAERARVAADVAHRIETSLTSHLQELQRLELLAERIELHRAERQRLEDRALRLEEQLGELLGRNDVADEQRARLSGGQQGLASRLDGLQEQVEEQRRMLVEQIRKLTGTQERTKRNQIQELEREIREMKRYVADLSGE